MVTEGERLAGKTGVIAIDGQVAAGKTVVGRNLAQRLGCQFLDTGIMYRAITWLALENSIATDYEVGLGELAQRATMRLQDVEGRTIHVAIAGKENPPEERELSAELRTSEIDRHVSLVARLSLVRRELVRLQRDIADQSLRETGGIVMVGRDIGTVVLPDADLKVFMAASPQVRAQRRYAELVAQGQPADYEQILENAQTRDRIDSQREDSPLTQAPDALLIDTDNLTIDQVVERILDQFHARAAPKTGQAES